MKRLIILALPIALLAGCGDGANEITTTNTGNVVPNDSLENSSFTNDEVNNTVAEDMNASMADNAVATDGTYGGMTNVADNGM